MCGIVCSFNIYKDEEMMRSQIVEMSSKLRHRGPDCSGVFSCKNVIMAHERLAIVDPESGKQPLISKDKKLALAVNGEIYNHLDIRKKYEGVYEFQTYSDCEVIMALYQEKGVDFMEDLNGIYAFALYDTEKDVFMIGRDHIGIVPLYQGWDDEGVYYVASELKALEGYCSKIEEFPPGSYYYSKDAEITKWYSRDWMSYENVKDNITDIEFLKVSLEEAVKRQLMSDVPYGALLSGGLDSSIITAIAAKFSTPLHSFAIGLEGSPDLAAARKVARHIGTVHHEFQYTIQEGIDALRNVIYHIETYDVTTVRASTPMFMIARYIKSLGIKMVLSGEGADEVFGGYLYFHKAPNSEEFHNETVRKLSKLHQYDCLRANKSLASWGVEGRVPFLDKEFLDIAMRINPKDKMAGNGKIEKYILRKAFEDYLPEEIAWRQKEQFSDGVGYSWIDSLSQLADRCVTDEQMNEVNKCFPINPPLSKEEYLYRTIYSEHFPSDSASLCVPSVPSIACSTPVALAWDKAFRENADPSGRAVATVHQNPKREGVDINILV
ncbi:MAG: asparagine synthase B [Lascolabacillus sp.]|jgi:asparagine synthase (glutamine-hydrolysing)|uniref:asparagine synthase B n=2 Tax=Lascolabacillus sp. TaxID=1924068 RepID=UPI002586AB48|nr:asparagine synthase B [Lascolabacillus sp.]MDD3657587.1 asparagine synthase B [Lascolabacillus sp.]